MEIIIAQLIWIISACLDGFLQAHYYTLYPSEKKHPNLHWLYATQRGILLGCIGIWMYYSGNEFEFLILPVACCFTYSFFHNGFYYMTRNKLDKEVYQKGFWDNTDTSNAFLNISVGFRTAMLIVGLVFTIGLLL